MGIVGLDPDRGFDADRGEGRASLRSARLPDNQTNPISDDDNGCYERAGICVSRFDDSPSFDTVVAFEHPTYRFGINLMFFDQNSGRQGLERVGIEDGDGGLQKDRAAVELFVDEVNGTAGDLHAVGERLILGIETGKGGQQRRMDIQDATLKLPNELSAQETHVACQTNPIDAVTSK